MGFGHRVYKNYDPRAKIIKETADKVIGKLVGDDPLFEIARELEEAALSDDYFIERKLYPNVDFYSGLIYRAMGLPLNMFPVLFALGRLPGLDRAVERDDRGPGDAHRPAAPDLHRRHRARLRRPSTSAAEPSLEPLTVSVVAATISRSARTATATPARPGVLLLVEHAQDRADALERLRAVVRGSG